ncbi:MAG TPA: hypothetical protein VHY34_09725 [Caulobacteraceae bacterium]|jgi:hypothetical protein|nr:hypothetical protein [Caulobacteraceae bacterium]
MFLALTLAAAIGSNQPHSDDRLDTALGELAYQVGACHQVLPDLPADEVVVDLIGLAERNPSPEQQRNRALFSGLFVQGQSSQSATSLSAQDCTRMIGQLTITLHQTVAGQKTL